ncbi:MAG: ferredoxin [Porticoccaceae bacterium]|nr:MAG: ferredoxin [Porticoccaceae bacterium]
MTVNWLKKYSKNSLFLNIFHNIQVVISLIFLLPIICLADSSIPDTKIEHAILKVFKNQAVMGEQLSDLPIWPVFQHSELVGYAFQSIDFVDLRGFAGKPINMLIGFDPNGVFQGVQVLEQHEPMFSHDLPGAMQRFVNQYETLVVTDRVLINNGYKTKPKKQDKTGPIHFDGISKATISLAVINKTVFSSALHVARSKLQAYKQQYITIAKPNLYEPKNWEELLKENLIRKWTITQERVEGRTGLYLNEFEDPDLNLSDPTADLNLYYGYLNTPMIGRNLLGDDGFEQLMGQLKPGEHAIGVISEGFYNYLNNHKFVPETKAENIYLEQQDLLISMTAINIDRPRSMLGKNSIASEKNLHIFKVPHQAGLMPNNPMSLILDMSLALPNGKHIKVRFKNEYNLPNELFETINLEQSLETRALWVEIWQSRISEIIILSLGLILLTLAFSQQQYLSKKIKLFHQFRWAFLFFTLFFIGFFAQGQLSVINIYTLLLELSHGFNLEFFLLDPIIFILWVYTAISLILWGRGLFCGWLCPFGALQEMLSWVAKKLKIRQLKIPATTNKKLISVKYIILFILITAAFYSTNLVEKLSEIEPFKTSITFFFIQSWPYVTYALLLLSLGLFIHKFYCRYVCPLGAGLAILGKFRRFEWLNRRSECGTPCQVCRHKCGINAIDQQGQINYNECIQCLECIVIINDDKQCAPAMVAAKKSARKNKIAVVQLSTPVSEKFAMDAIPD